MLPIGNALPFRFGNVVPDQERRGKSWREVTAAGAARRAAWFAARFTAGFTAWLANAGRERGSRTRVANAGRERVQVT
jgi:hypothetical protein